MAEKYTYLFPFEMIPKGSRILLYGAGDVGKEYYDQINITGYCNIAGFVDRVYESMSSYCVPVYPPDKIIDLLFDYVVLAFKTRIHVKSIVASLKKMGITEDRIIFVGARRDADRLIIEDNEPKDATSIVDLGLPEENNISVALKFGPGIGDCIIKKKLVTEILKMSEKIRVDIFAPKAERFIPFFYSDIEDRVRIISDGGALYQSIKEKYDLAMSVYYIVSVDNFKMDSIEKKDKGFAERVRVLNEKTGKYSLGLFPHSNNWIHYGRVRYRGFNYYTMYNYTGFFDIKDCNVYIPVDKSYELIMNKMGLKEYITFSYGNGVSSKGNKELVGKQWPRKYFEEFIELFKTAYPDIQVVQIGDKDTDVLKACDGSLMGENWESVKILLKNAVFHLDIDSGLVHLATQLGTKCIVLFGPTSSELIGYNQNINIVSEKCNGCSGMYDDLYYCARGLEEPECMSSITPERVFNMASDYLISKGRKNDNA